MTTINSHGFLLGCLAALLLLTGHALRAARLTALFPPGRVRRVDLLLALGMGYAVDTVVPFRLGELVRAIYTGKRCHIRYAYVAATITAERLADAVAVGLFGMALIAVHRMPAAVQRVPLMMVAISVAAVAGAMLIHYSAKCRKWFYVLSSVFNEGICFGLLDWAWTYSELVISKSMLRLRFVWMTVAMWTVYGTSYFLFAFANHLALGSVIYDLLGQPLQSLSHRARDIRGGELVPLLYAITPVALILLYAVVHEQKAFTRVWGALLKGRFGTWEVAPSMVSEHFRQRTEYESFLTSLFVGTDLPVSGFGLQAIEDGVVHRIFHGGSGAVIALVEVGGRFMIRKFTVGVMKDKLKLQVEWLQAHGGELPLVPILQERMEKTFYRFDMPYLSSANDFYEVIHTSAIDRSRVVLDEVVRAMHRFHSLHKREDASQEIIDKYLIEKVIRNATGILQFVRDIFPESEYLLNGEVYNLSDWDVLTDLVWLRAQIRDRRVSVIHGDLTVENIIVSPAVERGWYLIDPNPSNIFESPLIDWAKLLQSFHMGYEGMNRNGVCTWRNEELRLAVTRSDAYSDLHGHLKSLVAEVTGAHSEMDCEFHEIVNYLRLVPYKISADSEKGLTFFACTSILLRSYLKRLEGLAVGAQA